MNLFVALILIHTALLIGIFAGGLVVANYGRSE